MTIIKRDYLSFIICLYFRWMIRIGDIDANEIFQQKIFDVHTHPEYNQGQAYHDLAILKISYVTYTDSIKPICVPVASDPKGTKYIGKSVTVTGWGHYNLSLLASEKLKTASMTVLSPG